MKNKTTTRRKKTEVQSPKTGYFTHSIRKLHAKRKRSLLSPQNKPSQKKLPIRRRKAKRSKKKKRKEKKRLHPRPPQAPRILLAS
jgi:hypothetical protein